MPQQNVEVVRRFHASWASGDVDAVLECVDAEVEFDWSDSRAPFSGKYKGPEQLAQAWREMWDTWGEFSPTIGEVIECGPDRLITVTNVRGRGKGSGVEIEARGAVVWELRAGKITRCKLFQTRAEALDAVEASEQGAHTGG